MSQAEKCHSRPSAPWRSKQVLDAAEKCFQAYGFHTTSMAQIAAAAKISVGLIYRYFDSKDDIIIAIVERDIDVMLTEYTALSDRGGDLLPVFFDFLRRQMERRSEPGCRALCLEIMAETARNPRAATLLRNIRSLVVSRLGSMLQLAVPGRWSDEAVAHKGQLLLTLMDSFAFSNLVSPDQDGRHGVDNFIAIAGCILEHDL